MILFCLTFHFLAATNSTANNHSNIYHSDSHLQGLFYQRQAHDHLSTGRYRVIHPKFRPWFHSRQTNKSAVSFVELHPVDGRQPTTTLLQILTLKPQIRKQPSFAGYFFQQQLRAFFGHQHDQQHTEPTRSNIKTGLK